MLLHNCYKLNIDVSFMMFIRHSYLFVACFNFQVDVRPTLEMLRNAGIKVKRFHSSFCSLIHSVSLFLCNSSNFVSPPTTERPDG